MLRKTIKFVDKSIDRIVIIVSLLFFLICIYAMIDAVMVYYNANDQSALKYKPQGKEDAAVLRELSKDAVAWLTIDDTTVDYPVMHGKTNSDYLNKNPYGDYSLPLRRQVQGLLLPALRTSYGIRRYVRSAG